MVSSVGKVPRSAYVCKKRYSDCKIAVKKKLSMMHLHSKKTGGGPLQIELCEWEQRLRNKISLTAVRGISEAIDTERPSSLSTSSGSTNGSHEEQTSKTLENEESQQQARPCLRSLEFFWMRRMTEKKILIELASCSEF
ncbi:uncharacterized protein LOC134947626 isoform X2 [Pseudophryne corroboree]|uniref:uncharacterized protein LOC134947626 isoform X2 n=1 Tax=Pseudophryne corroboree TaxID=495146 RepID=UPI00308178AE